MMSSRPGTPLDARSPRFVGCAGLFTGLFPKLLYRAIALPGRMQRKKRALCHRLPTAASTGENADQLRGDDALLRHFAAAVILLRSRGESGQRDLSELVACVDGLEESRSDE